MTNTQKPQSAQARDRRAREEQLNDLRILMNTPSGRRLVWRFVGACNVLSSGFNTNAMQMAHSSGWRDAGLWWWNEITQACPEKFAVMRNEAIKAGKEAALLAQIEEEEDD